jgi:hypothetical protein
MGRPEWLAIAEAQVFLTTATETAGRIYLSYVAHGGFHDSRHTPAPNTVATTSKDKYGDRRHPVRRFHLGRRLNRTTRPNETPSRAVAIKQGCAPDPVPSLGLLGRVNASYQ